MILLIDNYDSFVWNLARYVAELGHQRLVLRNDAVGLGDIAELRPDPAGTGRPFDLARNAVGEPRAAVRPMQQGGDAFGHPFGQPARYRLRREIHSQVDRAAGTPGRVTDEAAAADRGVDQPAPARLGIGPGDRGEVDAEGRRQRTLRRQAVARAEPARSAGEQMLGAARRPAKPAQVKVPAQEIGGVSQDPGHHVIPRRPRPAGDGGGP